KAPIALLYLFLRHSLMLAFWKTSIDIHQGANLLTVDEVRALKREAPFVHVKAEEPKSESRWAPLYKTAMEITGEPRQLVSDYIVSILGNDHKTRELDMHMQALQTLKNVPTARLERVFAEHIDCCTYRYDAWVLGLAHYQLSRMRAPTSNKEILAKKGIYLGAYGWLEGVRRPVPPEQYYRPIGVELPSALNNIFNSKEDAPLYRDDKNGGYIVT